MFEFVSQRERRLWIWTALIVVAIFSTLGLARTLAGELRNRNMLDNTFMLALGLVIAAVVVLAVRRKAGAREIGIGLGVAAAYLLVFLRMAIPEERTHLIEYSILAAFILEALLERSAGGRPMWRPALLAIAIASAIGILDEAVQWVMPSRVFDPIDIAFNVLAAVMAVTASVTLRRARTSSPPVP